MSAYVRLECGNINNHTALASQKKFTLNHSYALTQRHDEFVGDVDLFEERNIFLAKLLLSAYII